MRYKIVRFQKLMWRNMMRSIKSKKISILHYSIDLLAIHICAKKIEGKKKCMYDFFLKEIYV